jgi:hypothetical protein
MKLQTLFCFSLLLLMACASPMKQLKKGNYEKAYKQANNQLKRGKSVNENTKVLKKSLTKIIAVESAYKEKLKNSNQIEDLEKAYGVNLGLQDKIENAFTYVQDGTFQQDFDGLLTEADWMKNEIASAYYGFGQSGLEQAIEMNDKFAARDAYTDFLSAEKYGYHSDSLDILKEKALEFSQLIYTVEAEAVFGIIYEWRIDRQFERIENYSNSFQRIVYEKNNVEGVDCQIEIEFSNLDFNNNENSRTEIFSQQIQTGTTSVTDADGNVTQVPVYSTVEGSVNIITRVRAAEWEININVRSGSHNCKIRGDRFSRRLVAEVEEYYTSGDIRAIPPEYRNVGSGNMPTDDQMAEELLEIIYREVVRMYFE